MTDSTIAFHNDLLDSYAGLKKEAAELAQFPEMVEGLLQLIFDDTEEVRYDAALMLTLLPKDAPYPNAVRAAIMTAFQREEKMGIRLLLLRKIDEFAQEQDEEAVGILQESERSGLISIRRRGTILERIAAFTDSLFHEGRWEPEEEREAPANLQPVPGTDAALIAKGQAGDLIWSRYDDGLLAITLDDEDSVGSVVRLTLKGDGIEAIVDGPIFLILYKANYCSYASLRLPRKLNYSVSSMKYLEMEEVDTEELQKHIRDSSHLARTSEPEWRNELMEAWEIWLKQLSPSLSESIRQTLED